jgi:hypothetical protein
MSATLAPPLRQWSKQDRGDGCGRNDETFEVNATEQAAAASEHY